MDKEAFDNYLAERYQKQMEYYSKASAKNQRRYKFFQWLLIVLSALTPVFAALNNSKELEALLPAFFKINIIVVVVSSIVAILTTGLKTFNYHELWVTYRSTYEKLKPEIHYYHFNIGPYGADGVDKEAVFVNRVELILGSEHDQWPVAKNLNQGNKDNKSKNDNGPDKQEGQTDKAV